MILKASHKWFTYAFFRFYAKLRIRTSFRQVIISGNVVDRGLPVIVIANHFSWWDGFWIIYMNMKIFKRKFFFMMLETHLRKHMFFNSTGGYSVKHGSKSVIESIEYTCELLKDKGNMVLLFPQGKIESMHKKDLHFAKGILRITEETKGHVQVVFAVNIIEYYSNRKPSLYMYLHDHDNEAPCDEAFIDFYCSVRNKHSEKPA